MLQADGTYHEVHQIYQLRGFALVRGTGISGQLCRKAIYETHSFLQEADEPVRRSCLSKRDRARRGYSPINTENFASLIGEDGPNDLVRKFRMGPPPSQSRSNQQHTCKTVHSTAIPSPASSSLLQANVWPSPSISKEWDESKCQAFQSTLEDYYDKICSVANEIVQAICDGLLSEYPDLSRSLKPLMREDNTTSKATEHNGKSLAHNTSILTLLGYRTGTRHKKTKKKRVVHPLVAAHTDVGVITVLLYDGGDCAVLQRQSPSSRQSNNNNQFQDVMLPSHAVEDDPIFVCNIADCLAALTMKRLPSTMHRFMPREGIVPRNCLALFVGLKADEKLIIDGEEMSYELWRKRRIAESQNVLRSSR